LNIFTVEIEHCYAIADYGFDPPKDLSITARAEGTHQALEAYLGKVTSGENVRFTQDSLVSYIRQSD